MFGRHKLKRENEQLRAALDWYADDANWQRKAINEKGQPRQWEKSLAAHDRGLKARCALTFGPERRKYRPLVPEPLPIKPTATYLSTDTE